MKIYYVELSYPIRIFEVSVVKVPGQASFYQTTENSGWWGKTGRIICSDQNMSISLSEAFKGAKQRLARETNGILNELQNCYKIMNEINNQVKNLHE